MKDADRKLAAPRIWQQVVGAAKSVVRHLNPRDLDSPSGLERLLDILRQSPLQTLPIADKFFPFGEMVGRNGGEAPSDPRGGALRGTSAGSLTSHGGKGPSSKGIKWCWNCRAVLQNRLHALLKELALVVRELEIKFTSRSSLFLCGYIDSIAYIRDSRTQRMQLGSLRMSSSYEDTGC